MKYLSVPIVGFICALVFLLVGGTRVKAATFDIAPGDVYGEQGLVNAMNVANTNGEDDIINLSENSEYLLTSIYNPEAIYDPYQSYPSGTPVILYNLTINGNGSVLRRDINDVDEFRIFTIRGGDVTIDNLTITGGNIGGGRLGGGILNGQGGGQLLVRNSIIDNNSATHGSGIGTLWSNVRVENSQIINNHARVDGPGESAGGGIGAIGYNSYNLQLQVVDSVISNNSALRGGGIYSGVTRLTLTDNLFENNQAVLAGGAVSFGTFYAEGTINVTGNTFNNNTAQGGGGLYVGNVMSGNISENRFGDNGAWAIASDWHPNAYGDPNGIIQQESLEIHNNCFPAGGHHFNWNGLNNSNTYLVVNAQNNWWGDASGPSGLGSGTGAYLLGVNVNYTPFTTTGCPLDHVNQAPTVEINGPYSVVEGGTLQLSATGFDADNDTLTYEWDLNNDGIFETTGQTVSFSSVGLIAPTTQVVKVRVSDGNLTAEAEGSVLVVYHFEGFFGRIASFPTFNQVAKGSKVMMQFTLNGDHGMNILASGYPKSEPIACSSDAVVLETESTESNKNGLMYHTDTDTYSYLWATDSSWQGTCRQFVLKFADGTYQRANFRFK